MIAIYLAAGQSRRMGTKKLSLPFREGKTIGSIGLYALLQTEIAYIFVIVHPADDLLWMDETLKKELEGRGEIIICPDSEKGQGFSLRCGVLQAINKQAEQIIVCLADQPFMTAELIAELMTEKMTPADDYIACSHKTIIQPPIIFSQKCFSALLQMNGDYGAKKIIANGTLKGKKFEWLEELAFMDIDTPADYQKLLYLQK
ncbi:NTP transferase domain-containing protein [Niallia sp. NCCP-28]|uniref:nucleotidyltransferase family protein n=1 Tax=Niallia sp. NCCP-28 TaxID=2934712 RepID=UPI00208BDC24|nr:NTP transferase domain-containing protein [Niallia sp. NCCP-28]GKU82865.1 xanthine dehydrogenase accessory protein PucB [Niallia sp. NCCP-28]